MKTIRLGLEKEAIAKNDMYQSELFEGVLRDERGVIV
jgi:hypothetical protein